MMKSNEIFIINQSVGYLTLDVCNAFASEYEHVYLVTGHYNKEDRILNKNIDIIPIISYNKTNIIKRIGTWIKAKMQINKILDKNPNADVIYFTNPPISYFGADKRNNRFVVVEYDIYPDALDNIKCPGFIKTYWTKYKKNAFKKALRIITLSAGMKNIVSKYCDENKIVVVPNWPIESNIQIVSRNENKFAIENGYDDKFIVMYSGNIGYTHNVETIIEVARMMKNDENVLFLIIGEGGKKESLIKLTANYRLNNVKFMSYLPTTDMKYSLSLADIGVVTLTSETANASVPSKTYNLLSYGTPLLAISSPNSELGNLINQYDCGKSFNPNELENIVGFIKKCATDNDYHSKLARNAKNASSRFTIQNAKQYVQPFI